MTLPAIYVDADVRAVLPLCPVRGRLGVAFDVAGVHAPVRLALPLEDACALAEMLEDYIAVAAGCQSSAESDSPSSPMSVPSDGVKV